MLDRSHTDGAGVIREVELVLEAAAKPTLDVVPELSTVEIQLRARLVRDDDVFVDSHDRVRAPSLLGEEVMKELTLAQRAPAVQLRFDLPGELEQRGCHQRAGVLDERRHAEHAGDPTRDRVPDRRACARESLQRLAEVVLAVDQDRPDRLQRGAEPVGADDVLIPPGADHGGAAVEQRAQTGVVTPPPQHGAVRRAQQEAGPAFAQNVGRRLEDGNGGSGDLGLEMDLTRDDRHVVGIHAAGLRPAPRVDDLRARDGKPLAAILEPLAIPVDHGRAVILARSHRTSRR